jgi:hypothetical protein
MIGVICGMAKTMAGKAYRGFERDAGVSLEHERGP